MGNSHLDLTGYLNYVWFLTNEYNKTTVFNYNLAVSGASVSQNLSHTETVDLIQQTNLWIENYTGLMSKARWNPNSTVVSYWFGTNDIDLAFSNNLNPDTYLPDVMRVYQMHIESVYKHGVRNFLLMNAGNITRTPSVSGNSAYTYEQLRHHARINLGFNEKFEEMYHELTNTYHDVSSWAHQPLIQLLFDFSPVI
ncbi:hypothetical protein KEM54_001798 [Ascosphaera aggregata]|nr:hypothetical protein KEM54_001798 [Ascosphaera aggregata]